MKLLLPLLLLLTSSSAFSASAEAVKCSVAWLNPNLAVVHLGSRFVTVAGWTHLNDDVISDLKATLKDAYAAAAVNNCAHAKDLTRQGLERNAQEFHNKEAVVRLLLMTNQEHPLTSIGMELTPKELEQSWNELRISAYKLTAVQAFCNDPSALPLLEILQGPEVTFTQKRVAKPLLTPLEDEAAKAENGKLFNEPLPFNDRDPRIKLENFEALKALWQYAVKQTTAPEEVFERGVTFAKDPAEKAKLLGELHRSAILLNKRVAGAYARDKFIAANILKTQGNMAVVIGSTHVEDLLKQLTRECAATQTVP